MEALAPGTLTAFLKMCCGLVFSDTGSRRKVKLAYCFPVFTDEAVTGGLLRELRTVAGIGLRAMAARTWFNAGYLSLVETGHKPVTRAVVEGYCGVLSDPALGLAGVDVGRLQSVITGDAGSAGASGVADVAVILERTRHLEDSVGAAPVVDLVRGMDTTARSLAGTDNGAELASEVARYRGWLEHATGRGHIADRVLGNAVQLAEQVDSVDQLAHGHSFRAYVARHRGDISRAVDFTEAAIAVDRAHPILRVYDKFQRAELLAANGDIRAAATALHLADRAADAADEIELPSFGYWYTPGFWGLERAIVLSVMGRHVDAEREAAAGYAALPTAHQDSGWAQSMLDQIQR